MNIDVRHGDCLDVLRAMPDNSVDAIATDPPYGLSNMKPERITQALTEWVRGDDALVPEGRGFMGKAWDGFVPPPAVWKECLRVLKPGGHMAVFAGARTQDLMGLSIRLAGFEIRDTLGWVYGSGFPKSMDISKAIDKKRDDLEPVRIICRYLRAAMDMKGLKSRDLAPDFNCHSRLVDHWAARDTDSQPTLPKWEQWLRLKELLDLPDDMDAEVWRLNGRKGTPGEAWEQREVIGQVEEWTDRTNYAMTSRDGLLRSKEGVTAAAREWSGWGTALKPAIEPIILARKPLDGTVAANVLAHGVGGLNIDACRVGMGSEYDPTKIQRQSSDTSGMKGLGGSGFRSDHEQPTYNPAGRFPANVLLDEHAAKEMDEQSGHLSPGARPGNTATRPKFNGATYNSGKVYDGKMDEPRTAMDSGGGASRFFPVFKYQAKAPKRERPVIEREDGTKIQHPTVKPLALLEWLVTLITPPDGVVLDPFAGTGTTLQAALNKGFHAVGIEQDADYIKLIEKRLEKEGA